MLPARVFAAALTLLLAWGMLSPAFPEPKVDREVFGYLPYWQAAYDFPHWELLTTVAFFAVAVDENGLVEDYSLWGEDLMQDLVEEAHSHGVRLVVTLQNFDNGEIAALLADPVKRATAIETCLTLIAMHGADGINVDFERVTLPAKSDFVTFMSDLKDAVEAVQPNGTSGHVTLAGPAIDWAGAYDYEELLVHTDGIFIMAYDYHWGSSQPGPTAPYADSETWGQSYSLTSTVADYLELGGDANRSKVILGLPLYGYAYNVADDAVPGVNIDPGGYVKAMSTSTFQSFAKENGGELWDEAASAVYAHGEDAGRYVQAWNENLTSLGMKMSLVTEHDLGGVGFWALGYEAGVDGFWTEVADHFGTQGPSADDPDASDGDPPTDAQPRDSETPDPDAHTALAEIGPDPDTRLDGEPGVIRGVPSASVGRSSTETVTTRTTRSGCASGGAPLGHSLVALLFLAALSRRRVPCHRACPLTLGLVLTGSGRAGYASRVLTTLERLMRRPVLAILCAAMLLGTAGCFEQQEPTCAYWVPKLDSPAKGEKAWEQIEELKCAEAIPYLEKMFDDGRDRERIIRSLTLIGDKVASASILKKAVMTRDAGKLAASIIEDWRLSQARPALEAILTGDTLPKHREVALEALLSFEKAENIEDLLITLANGDPNVQGVGSNRVAVEQLGAIGSEKAIPTLIKAAFMRDNRGAKIYQAARMALAQIGPQVVEPLIATIEGKNEELKTYARDQGIQPWEWQLGPEIVQIVTDTLDGRVGPAMAANTNIELNPPMGISEAMSEKWRIAQMNRLKVGMLGMGHAGPGDEKTVAALIEIVKDPLKDAVNQRLNSATTLALIGTSQAQDALLAIYDDEVDTRFCAPMLQPIALGLDAAHMKAFQKVTKKISKVEEESLRGATVSSYLATVHECKDDATCYLKKLESDDLQSSDETKLAFAKNQAVKSAVMLARGLGDAAVVRAGLLKAFANMPENSIDLRRFTLIALTRVGDAMTGRQLIELAENAENKKGYWPSELLIYGNALKHRK